VAVLNFIIFELMPGNPLDIFIRPGMTHDQIQRLIDMWGLNKPIWDRFIAMFYNLFSGNFLNTVSFVSQKTLAQEIGQRLLNTFLLVGTSTVLAMVIGIMLGVISAYKRGTNLDSGLVLLSLATYSFPTFWMGMLAILIFALTLHWLPIGLSTPMQWATQYADYGGLPPPALSLAIYGGFVLRIPSLIEISGRLYHLILPCAVLTLFQYGGWLLLARASMLETITEDYVTTARAKGIKERTILFKHVLKNASLPLVTSAALSFGFMLSGAIITEGVFDYGGIGSWLWSAVGFKDFPVLQAMFFIIAVCVIVANFIADLLYGVIDPRIKYS
jgi:peptide/nickel transport system permease protein